MGILEPITHKEEIEELLNNAQSIYDNAKRDFEKQKDITTKALKNLGKLKIKAWSEEMHSFAASYGAFGSFDINRNEESLSGSDYCGGNPQEVLINIDNASMSAAEIAKTGAAAVGTGALVGVAAYGGAMMLGSASTGTAISNLKGIAKTNATLAWFGGGAKAVGGLGMAGGKLVLAGIVVAPIIGVASLLAGTTGREKLAEAKKTYEEAEQAVSQMKIISLGMQEVTKISEKYSELIKKIRKVFRPFTKEVERIRQRHSAGIDGRIDIDTLSEAEKKTLQLSWQIAQIYYRVLNTPIMNSNGEAAIDAQVTIKESQKDLKRIGRESFRMKGDEAPAGNLYWKPIANRTMLVNLVVMLIFVIAAIASSQTNMYKCVLYALSAVVACPLFVIFRKLPASRLYVWRIVRVLCSILVAIAGSILIL